MIDEDLKGDVLRRATRAGLYGEVKALYFEINRLHDVIREQKRSMKKLVDQYAEDVVDLTWEIRYGQ